MKKKDRCPNCNHRQFYIRRYTPLYTFDECDGLVCEKCGWDIWSNDFFKNVNKRRIAEWKKGGGKMKKITVEELKKAVKEKSIKRWIIHECSMCGYPCGYYFAGDIVKYDAGCNCVDYQNISERTWEEVVNQYNRQIDWAEDKTNEHPEKTLETIKKDAEYFGFDL